MVSSSGSTERTEKRARIRHATSEDAKKNGGQENGGGGRGSRADPAVDESRKYLSGRVIRHPVCDY